ncbi:type VI secretion system membrane subunit TssM [Beijerinckiaceae bacterium]|nr:type VI secretion system membrane subunit TssM [Beijerinckiaceae bacterium]
MNKTTWLRILVNLAGAGAIAALIWFAGPWVSVGGIYPLEDTDHRIVAMLLEFVLVAGIAVYRFSQRRKGAERIALGLSADDSDAPVLAGRMREALGVLRGMRGGRANYLYDLPWYVLIGPPGSGKTTALVNSGLEFPLAKGVTPGAVAGTGGTRYCDWWFTKEAVLIDTAGRYTTQDSDAKADQKSWLSFLALLKRNRPRQPINGVLVAISVEDLLTLDDKDVTAHAAAIKARLIELHTQLKVDFPVYVIFTKADLVIGFSEFFRNLDEAGRAQVWGTTFQTMDKTKSMLGDADHEFESLVLRLNMNIPSRLAEEKDPEVRVLLFGFPAQVEALRPRIIGFLNKIFDPQYYPVNAALRGYYFTSGTQQGTPIDQLLGALVKGFGGEAVGRPAYSGQGKSFFLTDLIKKVVIGEAGWVSSVRANRIATTMAFVGLAAVASLIAGAWWISYSNTRDEIAQSEDAVVKYHTLAAGVGRSNTVMDRDLGKVLPALHALRFLPDGFADHALSQPRPRAWGLSQTERLESAAETAYGTGLERMFRPRLVFRLEEQIEEHPDDPAYLLEALKVYLMLGGLQTVDRRLVTNWVTRDWSENLYPGPKNSDGRKELEEHLAAMLDLETGHDSFVSLNGPLVERTQATLTRVDVAQRAYQLLAARAKASLREDWTAVQNGGAGASLIFEDPNETIRVPYFYTKAGFVQAFLERLPGIQEEMTRDRSVLGPTGVEPAVSAQFDHLQQNLVDIYTKAFIGAWNEAIGKLRIRRLTEGRPTYPLLAAAASSNSPISRILESIRDETSLEGLEPVDLAQASGTLPAPAKITGASGETAARMIATALRPYHQLVSDEQGQRPIDGVLSQLNEIHADLSSFATKTTKATELSKKLSSEVAKLKSDGASLPQPFQRMIEKTADDVARETGNFGATQAVLDLRDTITFTCRDRIATKYPFARGADQEVTLDDFAKMFGPKGAIDRFVNEYVSGAADINRPGWKWRQDSALAKQLAPDALANFERAAEIRDAFFSANPASPGFSIGVTPPPNPAAKIDIDGTAIAGQPKESASTSVQWPGAAEDHRASISFAPAGRAIASMERTGVWSLYRLLDAGRTNSDGTVTTFSLGGQDLRYRFSSSAIRNPLNISRLRSFQCPDGG